ncbi:MAG: hypothetical protein ABSG01_08545 [Anaerolineales bacterium]|jgi:hypothetical protein
MAQPTGSTSNLLCHKGYPNSDLFLVATSIILQIILALFLGHAYDMRVFMATGYLVGTGQNPYIAQDLSSVFHNSSFQGITTLGYFPPWAIILGLIYLLTYRVIPNFLLYNLAIKLPVIAINICLAYLVLSILRKMGVREKIAHRACIFLLFNPFLLLMSAAWGQFDSIVTLLSLLSLLLISEGKLTGPAILLALAISFKPIALPIIPVILVFLAGKSIKRTLYYLAIFAAGMVLFCAAPFALFGWSPAPILQHWDFHFTVGGGLSFMTFLEFTEWSYALPGQFWFLGWLWVPALGVATYIIGKGGVKDFNDLIKKSAALILIFYLCRAWVAETNVVLLLPFVLILITSKGLNRLSLAAVWVLPLIFSFFNTSLFQLLFPSLPGLMDRLLQLAGNFSAARYDLRTLIVIIWLVAGWLVAIACLKKNSLKAETVSA